MGIVSELLQQQQRRERDEEGVRFQVNAVHRFMRASFAEEKLSTPFHCWCWCWCWCYFSSKELLDAQAATIFFV